MKKTITIIGDGADISCFMTSLYSLRDTGYDDIEIDEENQEERSQINLKVKYNSDDIWEEYLRVKDMRNIFNEKSYEWKILNKHLWNIVERYMDALIKENS